MFNNKLNILIGFYFLIFLFLVDYGIGSLEEASRENIAVEANALGKKKKEDAIPIIEIRGEGKPMTSAQIRNLEEISNGGPVDIKIEKTWVPGLCPRQARRLDFVTFHYKGFSETGKKFDQTYGRLNEGIRIQLGVGMIIVGLDKGLRGMCDQELRKIHVPYRLSQKKKSKVWKLIPNDEHWLTFNIEMLNVEEWTIERQFAFLDMNNDSYISEKDLVKYAEKMRKEFGKTWHNEDIDNVLAAKYYIKYFDVNGDAKVELKEFKRVFERDQATMALAKQTAISATTKKKSKKDPQEEGLKREPGFGWILDFNNDGYVSVAEMDAADQVLQGEPAILPKFENNNENGAKEEL